MNWHTPTSLVDRLPDALDAANLTLDAVGDVADIGRKLLHPQEDVQRVLPAGHPPVDEFGGEVTT